MGKDVVKWIGEGLSDFGTELNLIFVQPVQDVWDELTKKWEGLTTWLENKWNDLKSWWENRVLPKWSISLPHISVQWEATDSIIAQIFGFTQLPHLYVNWDAYAQGGFPEDGLFFANHGELVGQFSNGKTAVANNEQITEGISTAVYDAFMTAFSQTGGSSGNDKEVRIYLDGKEIARSTTKYQNQMARAGAY